jgi:fructose/tagatose bisphosphate aldolase
MALASTEQYAAMLDGASAAGFAFPAINVTSSQTLNAALRGFADAGSQPRLRGAVRVHARGRRTHFRRYDGVLRVDGGIGDKGAYDPRAWGREAEAAMAATVAQACAVLGSAGRTLAR